MIIIKFEKETLMIWNYYTYSGFYYLPPYIQVPIQSDNGNSENLSKVKQLSQTLVPIELDLTKEDHLKAGYEKHKKLWTQDQDNLLVFLRDKKRLEWEQIGKIVENRNAKMCYSRYKRLEYNPRANWKQSQNKKILELLAQYGENWLQISKSFKNRRPNQIKQHYENYLKIQTRQAEWTLEQDLKLVQLLKIFGLNWKQLESHLEGRTQSQIKNRYFGRLKRINDKKLKNKEKSQI